MSSASVHAGSPLLFRFPSGSRRLSPLMVMGYFDDSSTMNRDLVCMAGYLADDPNWTALTTEWNLLLGRHKIPYLHLADFRAAQGIYAELGWKKADPRIDAVLGEFILAVRKFTIAGVGVTLDATAYREITKGVKKKEKPQVFCFERLLRKVVARLDSWNWIDPVCLIFDDSKEYAMQCYSNLWEIKTRNPDLKSRVAGIAFGDDEHFAPLQTADLISYATVLAHRQGDSVWAEGSIFRDLLIDVNPSYGKMYDGERWNRESLDEQRDKIIEICNRPMIQASDKKRPKPL